MSNTRYIEIDSTFRNRKEYPNPGQFIVPLAQSGTRTNGITAHDPIVDSYPYYPNPLTPVVNFTGGTPAKPILDANASTIDNFYINSILEDVTLGEFRIIKEYDGSTQEATLDSPFSGAWGAADQFQIRNATPLFSNNLAVGSTLSTAVLPAGASLVNNYYKGMFIWITSGPASGDFRTIIDYDATTLTATVGPNFSNVPLAGDSFEILQFSRDNLSPLNYTGSDVSQQEMVCYEVELINLVLPNKELFTGSGGLISMYPYVYVELSNWSSSSGRGRDLIYSNNPNSGKALFRAAIDDVPNPLTSPFIKIDSDGQVMTVKFKPNDNFRFSVYLPNGEVFQTAPDNFSPLEPNCMLQISAMFAIKRL